jgi:precorrin-6x reductase
MKDIYDQRMKVRTKGIHTATQKLAKEDNDIANMIDKTNPGYAKKIAKSKAKIAKDSTPTSRYMSKRKDKLKSMVVKESSASDRVAKKLNDMETQKSFATGKSKIPDYSQRPRNKPYDLSKKVQTVKEAAKKAKDKEMKPETFQDEPTLNNNISKNDSN